MEGKFSNQNMQNYYNEIMKMETKDLNLMIAETKVKLDKNKSILNIFLICYISFIVLDLPQKMLPQIFDGDTDWNIIGYCVLSLIALLLGATAYNVLVSKLVEEYEVLNYLKEKKSI